jgi:hypothetical protein
MKEQSKVNRLSVNRLAVRALCMPIFFCKDEKILESWLGNPVASVYCAKHWKPSRAPLQCTLAPGSDTLPQLSCSHRLTLARHRLSGSAAAARSAFPVTSARVHAPGIAPG